MLYGIISDIHANPSALIRVLEECEHLGVERIICAGDVVGYGPDPVMTIRILRERAIPTVMGNHDAAVAGLRDESTMIGVGQAAVIRHRAEIGDDDMAWLKTLPYVYEGDGFAVAHASFLCPERMSYVLDRADARDSFVHRSERLLFVGHTHVEALFGFGIASDPKFPECVQIEPRDFRALDGWQYLMNVGSIGYPRSRPYSSFVTLDSCSGTVRYHHVPFDFKEYTTALMSRSLAIPPWMSCEHYV